MRCAACQAENAQDAAKCTACGAAMSTRPRRPARNQLPDSPFSPNIEPPNLSAAWAYRIACFGLVPGPGLVLGPAAALLGAFALWRHRGNPEFTAVPLAWFGVSFGILEGATNALGLWLIVAHWPWNG